MTHTILTFIAQVERDREQELTALLAEIAADLTGNAHVPFGSLKLLHFACLVILPDERYGPYLVFENNFDGPLEPYLDELLAHAADGLHRIYSHCRGYRAARPGDQPALRAYLLAHVVRPNAYHIGNVGRSAERIRQETALREEIETFLDELVREGQVKRPDAVRESIQKLVSSSAPWAANVGPRQSFWERVLPQAKLRAVGLGALLLSPVLAPALLVWALVLRWKEANDPVRPDTPRHEHVQRLEEREDRRRVIQNHMASITYVKAGWFRRATLWVVLWVANLVARTATKGELSGIPSIHFAHWSMIDNGRRLLFLTNYDGSWENYLDDFIDKASSGLTAIWSNTVGFPRAWFLVQGGSRDGARFKAIARDKQVYTNVWYSAYPELTVVGIDNNSAIREEMYRLLDEQATREWLRRF